MILCFSNFNSDERYHIVYCFNIVLLNLDFNNLGNIWYFDLWMLNIHYTLIIIFSKISLMLLILYTCHVTCCSFYQYLTVCEKFLTGNNNWGITIHDISIRIPPPFFGIFLWVTNTKYKSGATYTTDIVPIYDSSKTPNFNY